MINLLLVGLLLVAAYFFGSFIRKNFNYLMIGSIILSIVLYFVEFDLVTKGFIGLAFFIVVMYGGAFKKSSKISKRIRAVRKEYSILGFIFVAAHSIFYLIEMLGGTFEFEWLGIIAFIIMIPLFITSFSKVRSKMNAKDWKNLQKFAYPVYLLIFIHLMLIGSADHLLIYIVIFSVYTALKLYNYLLANKTVFTRIILSALIIIVGNLAVIKLTGNESVIGIDHHEYSGDVVDYEELDENNDGYLDGVYTGYGTGFQNLAVEVVVEIVDGEVKSIELIEDGSTSSRNGVDFEQAAEDIAESIVNEQSLDVDTVSGATYTSNGVLEAVNDALEKAKKSE